jgi:hypothetical protein
MKDFLSVFSTITLQRIPHLNVGLRVAISGSLLDFFCITVRPCHFIRRADDIMCLFNRDDIFRAYHESQVASRKRSTDSPSTTTTSRKRRRGSPTQIEQKAKTRSTNGNGVGDEPIILDIDASSDVEHASRSSDDEVHALSVPPMQSTGPSELIPVQFYLRSSSAQASSHAQHAPNKSS